MTTVPNSKPRPVFIAALPREIAGLVSGPGWTKRPTKAASGIHFFEHPFAIVACAGMGSQRATLALDAALTLGPASTLISIGWAGGCDPEARVGDVLEIDIVIDSRTGERFATRNWVDAQASKPGNEVRPKILVTVPAPANLTEKTRLNQSYQALAVDMEAAAIARAARAREMGFFAIKAISDDHEFELPDMRRFIAPHGHFRETAFGLHVAVRPSLWGPVMTMAKGSKLAAERLQEHLKERIETFRKLTS